METLADGSRRSELTELEGCAGAVEFFNDGVSKSKMLENKESTYLGCGGGGGGGGGGSVSEVVEAPQKENGGEGAAKTDDYEVEEKDEEDWSVFSVGEFVWGKIKNHPWWPGQIYDVSDASELALKHKPKDKDLYLVAYFGDGTFSWCSGAQLKSFDENFQSLSRQSSLKSFLLAVEDALSMIGELVELEMTCPCVQKYGQVEYARPVAENAGISKGVLVPVVGVGVDRLAVARFDTAAIVASIKNAAQSVYMENRLELTMLKSKLLAFYRAKGYSELPKYYFPVYIDGLEDINKSNVGADTPVDGWVLNPDGQTASANPSEKAPVLTEGKRYGRRKQKSLADTIKEETDADLENDKGSSLSVVKSSVGRTEAARVDDNNRRDNVEVNAAIRSKGRKRVATTSVEKHKAVKLRDKKRKTDSHTPIASVKHLGFEPVLLNLQTDARVGEWMSQAAKLIIESPPIRKQCNIIFEKEPAQKCSVKDAASSLLSDETIKQGQGCSSNDSMPKEMLSGIKPATLTPLHERAFGSRLDVFSLNKVSNSGTNMDENDDDDGRPLSAILFLTFSPGVSLPSKADLLAKYRQFGSLNEEETDVLPNSLSAQVVFIKQSEGEQAFDHMVKMNSPDSGVQYRIRYIPRGSKFHELHGTVRSTTSPQSNNVNKDPHPLSINYLKQKLETLISKLGNAEGDSLPNDLKNEFHSEMANLLEKLRQ